MFSLSDDPEVTAFLVFAKQVNLQEFGNPGRTVSDKSNRHSNPRLTVFNDEMSFKTISPHEGHQYFDRADELEVFMTRLFGTMQEPSIDPLYPPESVTVHFFLRSGAHNVTAVEVSGVYFVESMEHVWVNDGSGAHISQPPQATAWKPQILLRLPSTQEEWHFDTSPRSDGAYTASNGKNIEFCSPPFYLNVVLPRSLATGATFELRIADFSGTASFSFDKHFVLPRSEKERDPQFWVMSSTAYGLQSETTAQRLIFHNIYHTKLGFSGSIQYVDATYLALLLMIPDIRQLVNEGSLRFILWDRMLACAERQPCYVATEEKPYFTQQLQYSHAMLAFRGQNMLLALLDHDEYVMINKPFQSIQHVHRNCWHGKSYIHVENFPAEPSNYSTADWEQYWASGQYKAHPLEHYKSIRYDPDHAALGKNIVNPSDIDWCYIHWCGFENASLEHWLEHKRPEEHGMCAYLVHVMNQHGVRIQKDRDVESVQIGKWRWVLDKFCSS